MRCVESLCFVVSLVGWLPLQSFYARHVLILLSPRPPPLRARVDRLLSEESESLWPLFPRTPILVESCILEERRKGREDENRKTDVLTVCVGGRKKRPFVDRTARNRLSAIMQSPSVVRGLLSTMKPGQFYSFLLALEDLTSRNVPNVVAVRLFFEKVSLLTLSARSVAFAPSDPPL